MIQDSKLSKMNMLRGLFALEIVLGHVVRHEAGPIVLLGRFMICSVAFFFFVSGYGMTVSERKKENYLNYRYWINKPLFLIILPIPVYALECLIDFLSGGMAGYLPDKSQPFLIWYFFKTNWYLWELIVFYILFWIIFKFVRKNRFILLAVITLLAVSTLYYLGSTEDWLASAMGFPFGVLWGEYEETVDGFFHSIKGYIVLVLLAAFGLVSLFIPNSSFVAMVLMRNSICIVAIVVASYLCEWKFLRDNPVSCFLTKYSASIYLSQFVWEHIAERTEWNLALRLVFVSACTLVTALAAVEPMKKLVCNICKKLVISTDKMEHLTNE